MMNSTPIVSAAIGAIMLILVPRESPAARAAMNRAGLPNGPTPLARSASPDCRRCASALTRIATAARRKKRPMMSFFASPGW
jgi:hypothetical protein